MKTPRLRWRRRRAGHYYAGPWVVIRLPYHRPLWRLLQTTGPWTATGGLPQVDRGVFGTAEQAKARAVFLQTKGL